MSTHKNIYKEFSLNSSKKSVDCLVLSMAKNMYYTQYSDECVSKFVLHISVGNIFQKET